jgi:1,5-anhydro-D-fructose reductase (1,5-anhydro-D-mannitol-forming)
MTDETHRPGVALLGFAHGHQGMWGRVLAADPRVDVVCAWDDDEARGRRGAKGAGVPFEPDLDAVLARDDVTAVTICSYTDQHAEHAIAAARAGKDIMMQKPMTTTAEDCDRIVEAVEAAGVRFYQAHNLRFDPVHQAVKRLYDEGGLGRVSAVRRRQAHHFALLPQDILGWFRDPERAGGGVLMDEGAHAALWFLWMFGPPSSVSAVLSGGKPGAEETGIVTLRYPDGMVGTLHASWVEPAGPDTVELYGDAGVLVASGTDIASGRSRPPGGAAVRVWRPKADGPLEPGPKDPPEACGAWEALDVAPPKMRVFGAVRAFADLLVRGGPSPADATVGRDAVRLILAAYRSAREGREVSFDTRTAGAGAHNGDPAIDLASSSRARTPART